MKPLPIILFFGCLAALAQNITLTGPLTVGSFTSVDAPGAASFTDNFTRANADPMSDPASGGTWTVGHGTYNAVKISGNTCVASANNTSGARVLTPTFSANQSSSVTYGGSLTSWGPSVRCKSETDGDCYFLYATTTTNLVFYKETDNGSALTVAQLGSTYTNASSFTSGTVIKLTASGSGPVTLEGFVDGASIGTVSDSSSPYTTGQPGFRLGGTSRALTSFTAEDL